MSRSRDKNLIAVSGATGFVAGWCYDVRGDIMKQIIKQVIRSFTMGMVIPGLLFSSAEDLADPPQKEDASIRQEQELQQVWIPVRKEDGKIVCMELEEYVSRVVLGEMPASFDTEALKAQAVAARTYTLRCVDEAQKHDGAVCTDYSCCQEFIEPEDYIGTRGTQEDVDKVFQAVAQTTGQVLCYDGELICATYFASAGGSTESAQAVWGQAVPYLVPVSSPEESRYDGQKVCVSFDDFARILGQELEGDPKCWIGTATFTTGGGVDTIRIGDRRYSGTELRELFSLRSTVFTVSATKEGIGFETVGYGHRVGMSQYGADDMAHSGCDYEKILSHYYQGATLEEYSSVVE